MINKALTSQYFVETYQKSYYVNYACLYEIVFDIKLLYL